MTHEELAQCLIAPLWRGISAEYKRKYARSIWQQYEDNLRSAAYTAKLSTFLAKIMTRLSVEIHREDVERVAAVMQSGDDNAILKMLRDETALLVLLVRVANEERKLKFAEKKNSKGGEDANTHTGGDRQGAFFHHP